MQRVLKSRSAVGAVLVAGALLAPTIRADDDSSSKSAKTTTHKVLEKNQKTPEVGIFVPVDDKGKELEKDARVFVLPTGGEKSENLDDLMVAFETKGEKAAKGVKPADFIVTDSDPTDKDTSTRGYYGGGGYRGGFGYGYGGYRGGYAFGGYRGGYGYGYGGYRGFGYGYGGYRGYGYGWGRGYYRPYLFNNYGRYYYGGGYYYPYAQGNFYYYPQATYGSEVVIQSGNCGSFNYDFN